MLLHNCRGICCLNYISVNLYIVTNIYLNKLYIRRFLDRIKEYSFNNDLLNLPVYIFIAKPTGDCCLGLKTHFMTA